ncbi:calcium-activated chloride channel-domain-containing protein [Ochromonadaceae sp. CCMP2298]|nr:calcium-activated chloride channel-domain-containing protein [Ochromonadaceae sp. CCMP2298]
MWSVVFLELWKRREKTLANEWGMVDFRVAEEDRQEFRGGWIESPVDGSPVRFYPSYKRNKHLRQHYAIVLALVTLVLGVVISIYIARFALTPVVGFDVAKIIASIANAASIQIMNLLFSLVTHDLTERENHRTETEFEDSMITKIFMFQFVNSYASYFYLAFVGQFMGDCPHGCMPALGQDLAIILASRLVVGNIVEVAIPYYGWERKHRQVAEWEGKISRPEQEHLLDEYKQTKHSLRDYAETAIGFGYASLFVCSLPISALVLLLASVVEIRMDGWKLLHLHQRPFPRGCEDIGAWQDIFLLLSGIAVVTNAGLVAFTMTTLDTLPIYMRWGIFALFQWVCFALQGLIMAVIPDVPEEIDIQQQRMAFVVRKLIDRVADDNDEDEAGIEDPLEIGQYPDYGGRYASKVAVPEGATHKWRQL